MTDDTTAHDGPEATQADETDPTEAPGTEGEAAQGDPGEQGDTGAQDGTDKASREAAKYRRKLRATEAERDQLATRLEAMQRNEVERLAAGTLADPTDVWRDGTDLTNLLDDDGNIDPDKVRTTINELTEAHPHWRKPTRRTTTGDGLRSGASGHQPPTGTSWAQALGTAGK